MPKTKRPLWSGPGPRSEPAKMSEVMAEANASDLLRLIMADELSCDVADIHDHTDIYAELGCDSLDAYAIAARIEDELNLTIDEEEDLTGLKTFSGWSQLCQRASKGGVGAGAD